MEVFNWCKCCILFGYGFYKCSSSRNFSNMGIDHHIFIACMFGYIISRKNQKN